MPSPSTIGGINRLPTSQKRSLYAQIIPPELLEKFHIPPSLIDDKGRDLLDLNCPAGSTDAELALYHACDARDPVLFGHITDTIQGQVHILLYGMNDPTTQRYNVDRLPDGTKTDFGTGRRNIPEEIKALKAGLAPGQIYQGPHLFKASVDQFERFVRGLGHELYFAEPLYYHVAIMFERHGFSYQNGHRLMRRIQAGFSPGGDLLPLLDGSTIFRQPGAQDSIRLRSWAIHDNILGHPYTDVTMYKYVGKHAGVSTAPGVSW
ncbi:MAG: hypothetical protein R6U57_10265 [Anaerolineales bacterium]